MFIVPANYYFEVAMIGRRVEEVPIELEVEATKLVGRKYTC